MKVKEESSFLKKRSKKLLLIGPERKGPGPVCSVKYQKFFASFFQKRRFFLACGRLA